MSKENDSAQNEKTMSIWDHLGELRIRLLVSAISVIITTLISFAFANQLIVILANPIGGIESLQSIEITENISVFMRVSLLSGFILAFPIILYEIMIFILPGLKKGEKRWLYLLIPSSLIFFVSGVAFSYFVMLPAALPFLIDFMDIPTSPRLSNYIEFVTNLMFWTGLCFEMPLIIFFLAKLKLVTPGMLAKQWRIAVVLIAVVAAVASPTVDPINMGLLMLPLLGLYLLSILFAVFAK